jgi:hypothetical protein
MKHIAPESGLASTEETVPKLGSLGNLQDVPIRGEAT